MTTTALPPEPPKPEEQAQHQRPEEVSRRKFLFKLSIAANSIVGAVLRRPYPRLLARPGDEEREGRRVLGRLGSVDQFPEGETRLASFRDPSTSPTDGQTADLPCWVRRIAGNQFQVFAINCAHLGCPVRWFSQSKLFMCPCHGGAYYQDGSRASGPPERGLFEYEYKIEANNLIVKVGDLPTMARPGTKQVAGCPERQPHPALPRWSRLAKSSRRKGGQEGVDQWPA